MEKKVEVKIVGRAPILMHKCVLENGTKGRKKIVYNPDEEAEKAAYRNDDGKLFAPSRWFKAAMIKAATDFKMSGKKTYKEYIKSGVFIDESEIILDQQEYVVDASPVNVNRSKIMRWRPRFDEWSCGFTLSIIDDMLNVETLHEILEAAGKYKGIGDWRPEFGRFEVEGFKSVK